MAAPVAGVGFLLVNDLLTDLAYTLIEPSVSTTVPNSGVPTGQQTVATWDLAMYVGAQVVVGLGTANVEVVTITGTSSGTSFTATFANAHGANETIVGATFPTRQPTDPFFTQSEMLGYLEQGLSDLLADCPLLMAVATVSVSGTQQATALPSDSMQPVRVAVNGLPLRETSQSNLDSMQYTWASDASSQPTAYFRDKVGLQSLGIWPRPVNVTPLEVVYTQRPALSLGLADGLPLPDCFLIYPKYRALAIAYSKEGEMRSPALARYWQGRYDMGVKICRLFLESAMDPNLQMAGS